ncbi:MAG TPA: hypothetical protein DD434_12815, partial [Bacteroidales bacterium]|nr:hypothetical protein [Bacteroidales bacterium]
MRRFIRNTELIFVFAILFIGCKSPIQKQAEYLLPSYNRLELTNTKETGITTYNNYKIEGKLNLNELSDFPINVISEKEKAVIKWHK